MAVARAARGRRRVGMCMSGVARAGVDRKRGHGCAHIAGRNGGTIASRLSPPEADHEGLTNPQIPERIFVSTETVKTHVSKIFKKLLCAFV